LKQACSKIVKGIWTYSYLQGRSKIQPGVRPVQVFSSHRKGSANWALVKDEIDANKAADQPASKNL
jgi:hypothetical protein